MRMRINRKKIGLAILVASAFSCWSAGVAFSEESPFLAQLDEWKVRSPLSSIAHERIAQLSRRCAADEDAKN